MKKITHLILFIFLWSNAVFSQIEINTPPDLIVCEGNPTAVDLTLNDAEILEGLTAANYSLVYYETLENASNNTNAIANPTNYLLSVNFSIVYIRVFENANPNNFEITSYDIIVNPVPNIVQPPNLYVFQSPFTGFATFDLTANQSVLLNGIFPSEVNIEYYETLADAQAGTNAIFDTQYTNIMPSQTIYVRVSDATSGCFSITQFNLIVAEDGIVFIPDVNLKAKLLAANESNNIASHVNPNNTSTWNQYHQIDINEDNEIQFSEAYLVKYLNVDGSSSFNGGIQSLIGIEAFSNIETFRCSYNQISSLDLSVLPLLKNFYANNSEVNSVGLNACNNLQIFNIGYNNLTTLDFSECPKLSSINIRNNQISVLNLDNNPLIQNVLAYYNTISSFTLENNNSIRTLELGFNNLSNLELVNLPFLYRVKVQNNNLTTVDFSKIAYQTEPNNVPQSNILDIGVNNNVNLTYINLKNGFTNINNALSSGNLDNTQQYICVDENDVFEYFFVTPNAIANSFCSFNPGGVFNTITGVVHFDDNNDGCDANDVTVPFMGLGVDVDAVATNSMIYSNNLGQYFLFASQSGTYGLTPNLENPNYFVVNPNPAVIVVNDIDDSTTNYDFCVTANGIKKDLEIVVTPVVPARPGFEAVYKIVYKNKGNQTMSQDYGINFFYNHNLMNLVSTSVATSAQAIGGLQWDFENLKPFETRSILVTFLINPPTDENNPVNIDDVLTFTSVIAPQAGDEQVQDNTFVLNQSVVGSYDPNDITCLQGETVSPNLIGSFLHYMIRFENTGNYQAERVVVHVEIDTDEFDMQTLQLLNASHSVETRVSNGNEVEFYFENINLAPSSGGSGGHGNILLKLKTMNGLEINSSVFKQAAIYFDYNFPIITNEAETTFAILSNSIFEKVAVKMYPNPAKSFVQISSESNIEEISVFDVNGRLLQFHQAHGNQFQVPLERLSSGNYFVKIKTDLGETVEKLVVK